MKKLTDTELQECIKALVNPLTEGNYVSDLKVTVIKNLRTSILFEVTAMYEEPCSCTPELLTQIKEALEAENAEKYDDISSGGCETCDYWSSYGFAVRVW